MGAEVKPGDILVGKVTPKTKHHQVLRKTFKIDFWRKSYRCKFVVKATFGSTGVVIDVRVFNRHGIEKDENLLPLRAEIERTRR